MSKEDQDRYMAAAHAMQTGVALTLERDPSSGTPKHLRVGVNSAMVETGALVRLLTERGVFTEDEWFKALADGMETEAESYRQTLGLGDNVTLG